MLLHQTLERTSSMSKTIAIAIWLQQSIMTQFIISIDHFIAIQIILIVKNVGTEDW